MALIQLAESTLAVLKDLDKAQDKASGVLDKWIKEREAILADIADLADNLDKHSKRVKIAKLSGNVAATAGSIMTGAGLALSLFTLGMSNFLTAAGVGIGLAGVGTSVGSDITEFAINKNKPKEVDGKLKEHAKTTEELCKSVEQVQKQLSITWRLKGDNTLMRALQSGQKIAGISERAVSLATRLMTRAPMVADSAGAVSFVYGDVPMVGAITGALGVARSAATVLNAIGLILNVMLLTTSAMDVYKQKGSELAEQLRAKRHTMQLELDLVKKDLDVLLNA